MIDPEPTPGVSITLIAPPTLEPLESATIVARVTDGRGTPLDRAESIQWSSSDSTVAVVTKGRVTGRAVGTAVISATISATTASASVDVKWRQDATLALYPRVGTVDPGTELALKTYIRSSLAPIEHLTWTSSDPLVARVDGSGRVTAVGAGTAVISVRYTHMTASTVIRVSTDPIPTGFGYAYTRQAPETELYGESVDWNVPPPFAYSTSQGPVAVQFSPPYAARADFGWIGWYDIRRAVILHAVSLNGLRCRAFVFVEFSFGPLIDCWDGASTDHFELIAATTDAFTGRLAFFRPILPAFTSNGNIITERRPMTGTRELIAAGFSRSDSYAFVTAATFEPGGCTVAPASETPSDAMMLLRCANRAGTAADIDFNAIVFGADASRSGQSRVFAELDADGSFIRRAEAGLTLSVNPVARNHATVTVTGDAVSTHGRVPAVFLTSVSSAPTARCWISEPTKPAVTRVTFDVRCDPQSAGVLIGVTY